MPLDRTKTPRAMLIFSDVDNSPQLIAILKRLQQEEVEFVLFLLGTSKKKLSSDLESLQIPYRFLSVASKSKIPYGAAIILKQLISSRPTVLYASGQFATLIGMVTSFLVGVPNRVFTRHHSNFHTFYKMKRGILADKVGNLLSTKIIVVSEIVKSILILNEHVSPSKIRLIHNGIELDKFRKDLNKMKDSRTLNTNNSELFEIGVISRRTKLKGIEYTATAFVRILNIFPNAHLTIVGASSDSNSEILRILSAVDYSKYTFIDFSPNIPEFLSSLDLFIHVPVDPGSESFGLVYIESLAIGVPSIFTKSGILHELPSLEEYARIVPYMDSEAIYHAICDILGGTSNSRSKIPPEWIDQFKMELMADSYYRELFSV